MIGKVNTTPAAAVIIPTHNRADLLKKTLDSVLAQSVACEIFVMDDASKDTTREMVPRDYPQVHYHREEINQGPTFLRNKGARLSTAPFIFTIDDDCVLASPKIVEQAIEAFNHPRVGAVTLPFINVLQDDQLRKGTEKNGIILTTFDYLGGMIAFSRSAYELAGGYRSYLFMHVEEADLAIRLLQRGYVVRVGWSDPIDHFESPVRNQSRLDVLEGRNHVLYCFYNVPWPYFPVHLLATSVNCLRIGRRKGSVLTAIRGLSRGYGGMVHEFFQRKAVSGTVYRLSRLMKARHEMKLEEIEPLLPPLQTKAGA